MRNTYNGKNEEGKTIADLVQEITKSPDKMKAIKLSRKYAGKADPAGKSSGKNGSSL